MVRSKGAWSFSQGGIYEDNIYLTVLNILKRELGLPEAYFKLINTIPLGAIKLDRRLLLRARISTFSMFPYLRGKGYLGCLVRIQSEGFDQIYKKGPDIADVRLCSFEEARKLIQKDVVGEHTPQKQQMLFRLLDWMEDYAQAVDQLEGKEEEQLHSPLPTAQTNNPSSTQTSSELPSSEEENPTTPPQSSSPGERA